ncbi:SIMPL domain-containing protein [Fulvivirgaceae bacterium PWU5]|uniref:SIMPL domain-containing protein n=1 Tax=Dawidia cretensis TaxID=2782350 RepID=A0AAP2GVK1_9BACT|nr:SIMPL domain-containing protein [Dawidia cretensis]MBT1710625.1 SIMPL domain-containing protein [Dawidia cretensis]
MKSRILFVALVLFSTVAFAQQELFRGEHFIEVSGNAQQEIEPNEIYVRISLLEFEENRAKVALEKLDKDFLDAIKNAGIEKKRLELATVGADLGKLGRKDKDSFREKVYQLKLTSGTELTTLVEKLGAVKVNDIAVTRVSHSELEKLRLDLKIKALQAARDKADALAKSIGAGIGAPLMIREFENNPFPMSETANVMMRAQAYDGGGAQEPTAFRKITIQAQVTAQFLIK